MVVLLEVVVGYEVPVELEVHHKVLAPDVPGHSKVLRVHTCTRVLYSTVYSTRVLYTNRLLPARGCPPPPGPWCWPAPACVGRDKDGD